MSLSGLSGLSGLSALIVLTGGIMAITLIYTQGTGHLVDLPTGVIANNAKTRAYSFGATLVCGHLLSDYSSLGSAAIPTGFSVGALGGNVYAACDANDDLWAASINGSTLTLRLYAGATMSITGTYTDTSKTWTAVRGVMYDSGAPTKIYVLAQDATDVYVVTVTIAGGAMAVSASVCSSTTTYLNAVNIGNVCYLPVLLTATGQMRKINLSAGTLTTTVDSTLTVTGVTTSFCRLLGTGTSARIGAAATSLMAWYNPTTDAWDTANARGSLFAGNTQKAAYGDALDGIWMTGSAAYGLVMLSRWTISSPVITACPNAGSIPSGSPMIHLSSKLRVLTTIANATPTQGATATANNNTSQWQEYTP